MKYYLDLEGLSGSFYARHGLIEIDKDAAESMAANDDRLELGLYDVSEPAFYSVRFKKLAENDEGMSRVDRLYAALNAFANNLNQWEGEDMLNSACADTVRRLSPIARAELAFIALTLDNSIETETSELVPNIKGKQFAVVLAETMGPDWAQWMYHFTKVVTRLT